MVLNGGVLALYAVSAGGIPSNAKLNVGMSEGGLASAGLVGGVGRLGSGKNNTMVKGYSYDGDVRPEENRSSNNCANYGRPNSGMAGGNIEGNSTDNNFSQNMYAN